MATVALQPLAERTRVLVVEDEGIIARDIQKTLEDLGYVVTALASSASEALGAMAAEPVDLVLMDIRIRGPVDGIQAAALVRERFQIPVVYVTAHADGPTLDRAKASEPFGYIVKPFTTTDVKVAIEIALERHKLQRRLEERVTRVSAILRSVGEAIVVIDDVGRITYLNPSAEGLLSVCAAETIGKDAAAVIRLRSNRDEAEPVFTPRGAGRPDGVQLSVGILQRPDGSERLVMTSFTPIRRAGNECAYGSVLLLRDFSDLEKTGQTLLEANWALSRSNECLTALSHSIADELSEPLRAMKCYTSLLAQSDVLLTGSQQQYLEYISQGCGRMELLLSSLLDYYLGGHAGAESVVAVQTSRVLEDTLSNLHGAIVIAKASVQKANLPTVYAHPTALRQVFQNLIGNALKFRREDRPPLIEIGAERQGSFWKFTIADNGGGFDPKQAEQIFGLFKRADGREGFGSGVGLVTCRRLVEQYGGKIWAESNPGEGARFHFTLPGFGSE